MAKLRERKWKYNPGSEEARRRGCTCPIGDNNRGLRPPEPPDGWWVFDSCILHGRKVVEVDV